ncbi:MULTISPECIES: hypothetical protein [unclassified Streptomyces]
MTAAARPGGAVRRPAPDQQTSSDAIARAERLPPDIEPAADRTLGAGNG